MDIEVERVYEHGDEHDSKTDSFLRKHKKNSAIFKILNDEWIEMKIDLPKSVIPIINWKTKKELFKRFLEQIKKIQQDPYNQESSIDPERLKDGSISEEAKIRRTLHLLPEEFSNLFWVPVLVKWNSRSELKNYVTWEIYENLHKQYIKMLELQSEIESSTNSLIQQHFKALKIFGLFEIKESTMNEQFLCMEYLDPKDWWKHIESVSFNRVISRGWWGGIKYWFQTQDHPVLAKLTNKPYRNLEDKYTYQDLMEALEKEGINLTDLKWKNILYRDKSDETKEYAFIDQRNDGKIYH